MNPSQVSKQLQKASRQIENELSYYPEDEQLPAKIVLISRHDNFEVGFYAAYEGYKEAKRKDEVHFEVEFWFHGEIHLFD